MWFCRCSLVFAASIEPTISGPYGINRCYRRISGKKIASVQEGSCKLYVSLHVDPLKNKKDNETSKTRHGFKRALECRKALWWAEGSPPLNWLVRGSTVGGSDEWFIGLSCVLRLMLAS